MDLITAIQWHIATRWQGNKALLQGNTLASWIPTHVFQGINDNYCLLSYMSKSKALVELIVSLTRSPFWNFCILVHFTTLVTIVRESIKHKDKGRAVAIVYLDFTKAFDTVPHKIIIAN